MTERGIWTNADVEQCGYPHNETLPDKFAAIFEPFDIIRDFGCGDGYYVRELIKRNFLAMGYDGFIQTGVSWLGNHFFPYDLTYPINFERAGQVISLEVGEHIPEEFEHVFIDNLTNNCLSRMVLSWAIPGQGGIGHVNCRDNGYIIKQLEIRGFSLNESLTEFLRANTPIHVRYFQDTLLVFDRVEPYKTLKERGL